MEAVKTNELRKSILKIEGSEKGTAFLISPEIALTVAHAVDDDEVILKKGEREIKAKVLDKAKDDDLDIAVLKLEEELVEDYMCIFDIGIEEGDNWITYGYPNFDRKDGEKLDSKENKIDQIRETLDGEKYDIKLEYDEPKIDDFRGFSGSPLILNNRVVGIINTSIDQRGHAVRLTALSTKNFRHLIELSGAKVYEKYELGSEFEDIEIINIELQVGFSSTNSSTSLVFQPEVIIKQEDSKPYTILDKENYTKKINYLLDLAKDNQKNALGKNPDFVLMPEYSICGKEGVDLIINDLATSPVKEQVFVGGIEGISKQEFMELLKNSAFEETLKNRMIKWTEIQLDSSWFKSNIIIEKYRNIVRYYLQPKLCSLATGEKIDNCIDGKWFIMFSTKCKLRGLNFFALSYNDWVNNICNEKLINFLSKRIMKMKFMIPNGVHLMAFVLKDNNASGNSDEFREATREFLYDNQDWSTIHNRQALVFVINSSSNDNSTESTSIIFRENYNCEGRVFFSYSVVPREEFKNYTDIQFRMKSECIHSIELALPFSINDRFNVIRPCLQAKIHSIDGSIINNDPRYPNPPSEVCGYCKVVNDFIDENGTNNSINIAIEGTFFDEIYKYILNDNILKFRNITREDAIRIFNSFFKYSNYNDYKENCDYWNLSIEGDILNRFISFLSVLEAVKFNIKATSIFHGRMIISSITYDLLITYIVNKEKENIADTFRQLLFDSMCGKFDNRLMVFVIGDISNRFLPGFTGKNLNTFGKFDENGLVFRKLDKIIDQMTDEIDKFHSVEDIKEFFEQILGGRHL